MSTQEILNSINSLINSWNMEEAEVRFLEELEKDPNNEWFKEWIAYLYLSIWKKEEAKKYLSIDVVNSYENSSNNSNMDIWEKVMSLFNEWDIYWAEELCIKWLQDDPNNKILKENLEIINEKTWGIISNEEPIQNSNLDEMLEDLDDLDSLKIDNVEFNEILTKNEK